MAYEEHGSGTPVVLVHGFPFDRTIWRAQLDEVSKGARVLAVDLPGFGDSPPLGDTEPSIEDYADEVVVWANELGLEKLVLVGHSMAGYVAMAFARKFPERLSGLGLVCTRPGPDTEQARQSRYTLIGEVGERGAQAVADSMLPRLFSSESKGKRKDAIEEVRQIMLRQRPEGIVAALRAMAERPDSTPALPGIAVPTLVVRGAEDVIIPAPEADLMVSLIPGARHVRIDGAGHMPMMEKPDDLSEALAGLITP